MRCAGRSAPRSQSATVAAASSERRWQRSASPNSADCSRRDMATCCQTMTPAATTLHWFATISPVGLVGILLRASAPGSISARHGCRRPNARPSSSRFSPIRFGGALTRWQAGSGSLPRNERATASRLLEASMRALLTEPKRDGSKSVMPKKRAGAMSERCHVGSTWGDRRNSSSRGMLSGSAAGLGTGTIAAQVAQVRPQYNIPFYVGATPVPRKASR